MKSIFVFFIAVGFCWGINNQLFPEPKNDETDYERLCDNQNITLNFSDLSLRSIKQNFVSSPIITCLDLSNNQIENVDSNAFDNLPNLKYLNMADNSFDINTLFYKSQASLETLILDKNRANQRGISTYIQNYGNIYLHEIKFQTVYPKLKKLFIRNKSYFFKLSAPSKVNLPALTHLHLSGSKIINDGFNWLPDSLEYLDLSGHALSTLTLKNLINLKSIFLDNPEIKNLERINLKNLINLEYLSIPSNKISQITSSTFANIASLVYLDMSGNNIQNIEDGSLDSMNNLKFLNLSSNNIEIVRAGTFDKLINLKVLDLGNNQITVFPKLTNEINLEALILNCNNLKNLPGRMFSKAPNLEFLYLNDNEIRYIDPEAFTNLANLKILTLSNNMLSNLPIEWMRPLLTLKDLDLSGNPFESFENLALSTVPRLENLYLPNELKYIYSNSLSAIPKNVTIFLNSDYTFVEAVCNATNKKHPQRNDYY